VAYKFHHSGPDLPDSVELMLYIRAGRSLIRKTLCPASSFKRLIHLQSGLSNRQTRSSRHWRAPHGTGLQNFTSHASHKPQDLFRQALADPRGATSGNVGQRRATWGNEPLAGLLDTQRRRFGTTRLPQQAPLLRPVAFSNISHCYSIPSLERPERGRVLLWLK